MLETADTICNLLNLKRNRVYELCRNKQIPHVRIGERQYRFDIKAIEDWIRNGGSTNTSQKEQSAIPIKSLA